MKDDFLTIPDAPNYEINSKLICRNKKTGCIIKKSTMNNILYYRLYGEDGRLVTRTPKTFRQQAVAALNPEEFLIVPSLGGSYEVNKKGNCRHVRSKTPLKLIRGSYHVFVDGKSMNISRTNLLWEVFGKLPARLSGVPKPLICSKANRSVFFDTRSGAAYFLAQNCFYALSTCKLYLKQRKEFIGDWHVNYLEDEKPGCRDALVGAYYGPDKRKGGCGGRHG